MEKLQFEKKIIQHQECYISGIYKIVKYGEWRAYFIPSGWSNWGNAVEHTIGNHSIPYKTVKKAIAACKRHSRKFGEAPNQFDTIFVS